MEKRHKILLLDDDPDVLAVYREVLAQLPTQPEIHTATTGSRAIALLDGEPFRLLICDLKMPKMDGLQVLAIVRRRFPGLRTIVLTSVQDEEFRSRAYALGVDLFWLKPETQQNMKMFLDCVESLLGRDTSVGFRGIQNKSLMDIVQMECLSQSSTVLRLTRGALTAKLWIQNGDLIDAEVDDLSGEAAFRRILEWKSGTFENLPPEPARPRTINKSVNALLLESAQAMDEANLADPNSATQMYRKAAWNLTALKREGADFAVSTNPEGVTEAWGTQSAENVGKWMSLAADTARKLGDKLGAGPLSHILGANMERQFFLMPRNGKTFMVAWPPEVDSEQIAERGKQLIETCDS